MCELKKFGKVLTSKSVGTGPSSYKKRIYRPTVSQKLRSIVLGDHPLIKTVFEYLAIIKNY